MRAMHLGVKTLMVVAADEAKTVHQQNRWGPSGRNTHIRLVGPRGRPDQQTGMTVVLWESRRENEGWDQGTTKAQIRALHRHRLLPNTISPSPAPPIQRQRASKQQSGKRRAVTYVSEERLLGVDTWP